MRSRETRATQYEGGIGNGQDPTCLMNQRQPLRVFMQVQRKRLDLNILIPRNCIHCPCSCTPCKRRKQKKSSPKAAFHGIHEHLLASNCHVLLVFPHFPSSIICTGAKRAAAQNIDPKFGINLVRQTGFFCASGGINIQCSCNFVALNAHHPWCSEWFAVDVT